MLGHGPLGNCLLSTLYRALFLHKHTYNTDTQGRDRCSVCIQRNWRWCVSDSTGGGHRNSRGRRRHTQRSTGQCQQLSSKGADLRRGNFNAVEWANLLPCVSAVTLCLSCFSCSAIKFESRENSWETLAAECKHEILSSFSSTEVKEN